MAFKKQRAAASSAHRLDFMAHLSHDVQNLHPELRGVPIDIGVTKERFQSGTRKSTRGPGLARRPSSTSARLR